MREGERSRVQQWARCRYGLSFAAIAAVADDRMVDGGEMDPHLVGTPGFEPAVEKRHERGRAISAFDVIVGARVATT